MTSRGREPMSKTVETVTKQTLIEAVATATNEETARKAADVVGSILGKIQGALTAGEEVKISGFGKFTVGVTKPRLGRNPITGEQIQIQPRRVLKFKPSNVLREKLNIIA